MSRGGRSLASWDCLQCSRRGCIEHDSTNLPCPKGGAKPATTTLSWYSSILVPVQFQHPATPWESSSSLALFDPNLSCILKRHPLVGSRAAHYVLRVLSQPPCKCRMLSSCTHSCNLMCCASTFCLTCALMAVPSNIICPPAGGLMAQMFFPRHY